jgi:restriction endonuclease
MEKRLRFEEKEAMVGLAGACFWFWKAFYGFLGSCGVPQSLVDRYPRETYNKYDLMRNVIGDLERSSNEKVLQELVSGFFRLRGPVDRDHVNVEYANRRLNEFRELVGDDPIEAEVKRREVLVARKCHQDKIGACQVKADRLKELETTFLKLVALDKMTPQQRGFRLETLFFDLLRHSEVECASPYKAKGEQIDGHFRYEKFDYLVESKWTVKPSEQKDLSIFDGKIRGKAQSTRGCFVSASGISAPAVEKFSGDAPRIVLLTGEDLALILSGRFTFHDALKVKIDAIVRHGKILYELRNC